MASLPCFVMNFVAHFVVATRILPSAAPLPLYVMANALPDLLPLAAPRVRLRPAALDAAPKQPPDDWAVMAGARAHLQTDAVFHKTRAFALASEQVGGLVSDAGFAGIRVRRFFLAHVLTELALDACLIRQEPALLDTFYAACGEADARQMTRWAEAATGHPLPYLPHVLARFVQFQYLRHYASDAGVAEGFNRLCGRAHQDTFEGENEQKLVRLTAQVVELMDAGLAQVLLADTGAALHRDGSARHDSAAV